jgi:hypothetical protein
MDNESAMDLDEPLLVRKVGPPAPPVTCTLEPTAGNSTTYHLASREGRRKARMRPEAHVRGV